MLPCSSTYARSVNAHNNMHQKAGILVEHLTIYGVSVADARDELSHSLPSYQIENISKREYEAYIFTFEFS